MNKPLQLNRRQLLIIASSSIVVGPFMVLADVSISDIHVFKNPQCGCCNAWIETLKDEGFTVSSEDLSSDLLTAFKFESGIPTNMMSCHTAKIEGYFIEGHVPATDIKRLLMERPVALGLSVPEMPYGSPGMGPEEEREAYDVFIVNLDGAPKVFQHYPKAGIPV